MPSPRVVVVDYGMGNVLSVRRALDYCGATVLLSDRAADITAADRLVLPGVGAFGDCMKGLKARGLVEPIRTFVDSGRPFLGICVGMQILFDFGEEFGGCAGLGFIPGRVEQIDKSSSDGAVRKIPHIGWTPVRPPSDTDNKRWESSIFRATVPGTAFYFVHSFTAVPACTSYMLAEADYLGAPVTAAVKRDNVYGVQFHPEKSGGAGLGLLSHFLGHEM